MKRASYRAAVEWIAANDDPSVLDLAAIENTMTVGLVADLFGKSVGRVGVDVQKVREEVEAEFAAMVRNEK